MTHVYNDTVNFQAAYWCKRDTGKKADLDKKKTAG